uniref:Uncharacterized protein n=1 Tax=Rhizophora mucronata TaxID=61149 RepID=A0A2P2R494_RHIMU
MCLTNRQKQGEDFEFSNPYHVGFFFVFSSPSYSFNNSIHMYVSL